MPKAIQIRQNTIGLNTRVQETGGPRGAGQVSREVAAELEKERDDYVAQTEENAYLKGQTVLSEDLERIERNNQADPDALTESLEEYGTSFLDEVSDPNTRARYELQISKASQTAIARATAKRKTIIDEESRLNNLQAFDGIKNTLPGIAQGLLNPDAAIALTAAEQMQEAILRTEGVLGATDVNGVPLFNASFRANQLGDLRDTALQTAASTWIDNQPDKAAALESFLAGELNIQLPNAEGDFDTVNVRDSMSQQTVALVQRSANTQIAEQEAQDKAQRNILTSQLELAIEVAADDPRRDPALMGPSAPALSKTQKLNNILQQIDAAPAYNDTPEGIVKGNTLRKLSLIHI